MKVKVNKDTCIGCSLCADNCPDVFNMDGDLAVVIVDLVPTEAEDITRETAQNCPVEAITIEE
jgi:ferredoxin